jgi:hypothetical protein
MMLFDLVQIHLAHPNEFEELALTSAVVMPGVSGILFLISTPIDTYLHHLELHQGFCFRDHIPSPYSIRVDAFPSSHLYVLRVQLLAG